MIHWTMVIAALVAALGGGWVASIVTKRRELRATDRRDTLAELRAELAAV